MVLRKHLLATLGTGLLPALSISLAHAMTVQPVKVKSALGEPFYAEIVITDLGQIDIRDIQVSLANNQELSRLGLSGSSGDNTLDLSLLATQSNNANVQGVIVIRSHQPINDPFLEFAVKIQAGPNNRIQRVNALLDPRENKKVAINLVPIQENNTAEAPIELATSNAPTTEDPTLTTSNTTAESEQALLVAKALPPDMGFSTQKNPANEVMASNVNNQTPPKEVDISSTNSNKKQRHLVQRNESLWKIAKQLQPQLNKPIDQIMQNIRDLNHDAFISGNPNQLKRGATLVLPDRDQNATLVNNALPPATPKAASKAKTKPAQAKASAHRGRLPKAEMTLVAPTTKGLAQGNSKDGRSNGLQPLSRELSIKVGQERRKTVLMQHEVSELDAQLALNDKKIAMLNAKLAEMEHQLKMRNQAKKSTTTVSKKVSQATLPLLAIVAVALSGLSPNVALAAEGDGGGFPIWIIPVAILIVALIMKFLKGNSEPAPNKRAAARAKAKRPTTRSSASSRPTPAAPTNTNVPQAPVAIDRSAVPVPPVTDALQDAQSFIDRERFTDATDILKQAISAEPTRTDLQIKLLEVFALENAVSAFEQQYQVVAGFNQAGMTAHADKLRQLLEEVNKSVEPEKNTPLDFTPSINTALHGSETIQNIHAHRAPTLPMDQSLADLEAEFGFDQVTPAAPDANPEATTNDNVIEFDLSGFDTVKTDITDLPSSSFDLKPSEAQPTPSVEQATEQSLDLEFDLSDAFDLVETSAPIAPQPIEPAPEASQAKPVEASEFDLNDIKLEDTNWATGFDDQEFDIGSTPTIATTSAITPNIEPSIEASTNQDADGFLLKEFPFLVSLDVQQTNLELAESYINLGEYQSAKELLEEVMQQGSSQQQTQAQQLMRKLAS